MSERVIDRVVALADQFRDQAVEAERIGRLTDDTVKLMKGAGLIRLLQTKQYRGFEAHPRDFAETVMATAALDPAAGWIVGVVGVHPYQLAYADPKVPAEVWADDADTWMATNSGFSNSTSQTDNGQMTGDSPPPLATYTWAVMNSVCPTLTASVTVQATPGPEGTTSATGSTVSIISGASCHFANISTTLVMGGGSGTGGSIDFTPGDSTFMWYNAPTSGDNPEVVFDIVC